uniref:UF2 component of NDC80 kinetochore complex n=1 Tax=Neolamprologus brichardi TaxID=32507 RepID=A0A3Q4HJZ6_NEOBR
MSENTFPVYTADAIVNFYRTEVLTGQEAKHFTKSDLTPHPKPEAVQTLYMRVLHLLYRFRPECHSMVPLLENIQYPAYHEGATAIMSVYTRINTVALCFQRADMDRLQAYTKGIREAEKKIEMLTTIPPEQQAEADELAAALSELQSTTMHEYQEVVGGDEAFCVHQAQVKLDVSNLKEDISKLKSQIVESPEELKSQMEKMRENVKSIKNSIEETDERGVELQNMVQGVTHTEAEIQQMYSLLQDLESSMSNTKQRLEEHQELMAQYEKKQKELKNLCMEEGQLKRALGMKQDKECKQNIRRQKKRETKEQHVQEVLGQCDQIHQKREDMADKIQEISAETQKLKSSIKSLRDVCSKETEKAQVQAPMLFLRSDAPSPLLGQRL